MQQMRHAAELGGAERKRVETVVETLATLQNRGESLAEVAHDARNMVTALGLYCDLLEEPGVLSTPFRHYGNELRLVATASRRLVEKLVALDVREAPQSALTDMRDRDMGGFSASSTLQNAHRWDLMPAQPINNLAAELLANRNLLAALAGHSIALTVDAQRGAKPVKLTGEDLTRVLVNLVKNAAEAMPTGGRIQLSLCERAGEAENAERLVLAVEDNGPGITSKVLNNVFESGCTTRAKAASHNGNLLVTHRGLGLSITRSIIEAAGGKISAANRPEAGARFEIELPVRVC